jgi:hypothetical protein
MAPQTGADIDAKNNDDGSPAPLHWYVVEWSHTEIARSLAEQWVHTDLKRGHTACLSMVVTLRSPWLIERGADVNAKDKGWQDSLHLHAVVTLRSP